MKRVWECCKPSSDVLYGELRIEQFGIEFSHVLRGLAPPVYQDPVEFFNRTYMTRALKTLLTNILKRTAGIGGTAIFVLKTGFGGGKTHALLAVYHLFKGLEKVENQLIVSQLLKEAGVAHIPKAKVVAIDCKLELDPTKRPKTIWGEIARQLGKYDMVRDKDISFLAPTEEELRRLLGFEEPVVILIDELGEYISRVMGYDTKGYPIHFQQIKTFFRALQSALLGEGVKHVLVITIPDESAPYDIAIHRLLRDISDILGREGIVSLPIESDEIFHVIKKRLFEYINENVAREVAREFFSYYNSRKEYFPAKVLSERYYDILRDSYPFHPELIHILYERIATIPEFQRTRGVLRLLALIVKNIWSSKASDAYFIMPKHVDLLNKSILDELTAKLGRSELQLVVRSDIESPDESAKAQVLARNHNDNLYIEISRVVFLYSLISTKKPMSEVAPTISDIRLAVATPDLKGLERIDDVLQELSLRLWHLYTAEKTRYWFEPKPNINKVIEDYKDTVTIDEAKSKVRKELNSLCNQLRKTTPFQCVLWEEPNDDQKLKIVLLNPENYVFTYTGGYIEPPDNLKRMFEKLKYKNTVIFILPLRDKIDRAYECARYVIACEKLLRRHEYIQYRKDIEERRSHYLGELISLLIEAHSILFYPSHRGLSAAVIKLPRVVGTESDYGVLAKAIKETLEGQPCFKLVTNLSNEYLWDRYFDEGKVFDHRKRIPIVDIIKDFKLQTSLPMIANGDVLLKALNELLDQCKIAYASPKKIIYRYNKDKDLKKSLEILKKAHQVLSHSVENLSEVHTLKEVLKEFEDKYDSYGKIESDVGEILDPREVKKGIESYIERIKKLLEVIEPKLRPEGTKEEPTKGFTKVEIKEEWISTRNVDELDERFIGAILTEVVLSSKSLVDLRNLLKQLELHFTDLAKGIDIELRNCKVMSSIFELTLSSTKTVKDIDTASNIIIDLAQIEDIMRQRYSDVKSMCTVTLSNVHRKLDQDDIDRLKKLIEMFRDSISFEIKAKAIHENEYYHY